MVQRKHLFLIRGKACFPYHRGADTCALGDAYSDHRGQQEEWWERKVQVP